MKRWLGIVLFVLIAASTWVMANDYVDDVYVWVPKAKTFTPLASQPADDIVPLQTEEPSAVTIEFLDDSITRQNPDTVVRAIIRR